MGLTTTPYQSSSSGGWHLYLFLDQWENSKEVQESLRELLAANGYEIRNGVLEVFPSGNGLRLPLQAGFGWLDCSQGSFSVKIRREELATEQAIELFLKDLDTNASNWAKSKNLIAAHLEERDRQKTKSAQEHEEAISGEGFDDLFGYRLIPEKYKEGRDAWLNGLTRKGQRHDAILAVEHYLWHGDKSIGLPALPGDKHDENRCRLIRAWIERKHNGHCNHINGGKWQKVEAQIRRAVKWRRSSNYSQVRTPYLLTERSIERLIALSKWSKRVWTPEDLQKGNDGRESKAREKIEKATQLLIDQGKRVSCRQIMKLTDCSYHTVKRHFDIWNISPVVSLPRAAGDKNSFLDLKEPWGTGAVVLELEEKISFSFSESEHVVSGECSEFEFLPLIERRSALAPVVALKDLSSQFDLLQLTPYAERSEGEGEQLNGKRHSSLLSPSKHLSIATGLIAGAHCVCRNLSTCGINGQPPHEAWVPSHLILGDFCCGALRSLLTSLYRNRSFKTTCSKGAQYANLTASGKGPGQRSRAPPMLGKACLCVV
jgi:hypothetical protein